MLRHSLLLVFRNTRRFKLTFFINLVGLSSGIACALLICLWVMDEWSFDRYHENDDRLFQVMERAETDNDVNVSGHSQSFLAKFLASEMPEVEHAVTVTPPFFFPAFTVTHDKVHVSGVGKYVDRDFFRMFSHPLIYGDKGGLLSDKNSIVISEHMARSLFPDISKAVGQTLEYQIFTLEKSVIVTGVMQDVPRNSSEQFDFLLSFDAFRDIMAVDQNSLDWEGTAPFFTYVMVKDDVDTDAFNDKLAGFLKSKSASASHRTLFLKPFSDSYLYGRYEHGVATGRILYVRLFSAVAAFVLLIACINFMNLSTAKASRRLKEIGVKKVVGASRKVLAAQFMAESLLMSFLSLALSVLIVDLLLPQFNLITGKTLSLVWDFEVIGSGLLIALVTGLIAGSYPSLFLSSLNTVRVLRGTLTATPHDVTMRQGLVALQFAVSIVFIVAVIVVRSQIEYIQSKNLGVDVDNVLYFETKGRLSDSHEAFLNEVRLIPGVINASSMLGNLVSGRGDTPGGGTRGTHSWNGNDVVMNVSQVNYGLIETVGIQMQSGRSFSRDHSADTLQYIYNEAAIDALGIEDPVGLVLPNGAKIVGVAKNFHFQSMHEKIEPHCFMLAPDAVSTIMVKLERGTERSTMQAIERLYRSFNPGFRFTFDFLDEQYKALYASEQRVADLSQYCAGLATVISCLGLLGLAMFTAERRTKEIGIRKVLGSSVFEIVYLLSAEFTKIVLISVVIALPVSYILSAQWLASFAYRIPLAWWYFAAAAAIALVIAWITVGAQALRAARLKPTECLRNE